MDKNIAQRIIHALMILQLGMLLLGSRYAYVASVSLNFLILIPVLFGVTVCVSSFILFRSLFPPPPIPHLLQLVH